MPDLTAKRTLVKSPPELWEELSEVERLAKHLGAFGEIKITKLEPEHTVAWEGEAARGTVSIEPSGWGTKVTLTAQLATAAPDAEKPQAGEAPSDPNAKQPGSGWPTFEWEGEAPEFKWPGAEGPAHSDEPEVEGPEAQAPEAEAHEESDDPEVEEPKVEEPKAGEPKVEEPQVEEPRIEAFIAPKPRRKRGFFARLFGRRAAADVGAGPPGAPEPAAAVPVWV